MLLVLELRSTRTRTAISTFDVGKVRLFVWDDTIIEVWTVFRMKCSSYHSVSVVGIGELEIKNTCGGMALSIIAIRSPASTSQGRFWVPLAMRSRWMLDA